MGIHGWRPVLYKRFGAVASVLMLVSGLLIVNAATAPEVDAATTDLPSGFVDEVVLSGLDYPTVISLAPDGRVFVAEKSGIVKVFDGLSDPTPTVFADLRTQTHNWWDRGLLGLAVDPQFPARPYVYVQYSADKMPGGSIPQWGSPGQTDDPCPTPPGATDDGCVAMGRISRLTVANGGLGDTMTGPENVLVEDWCVQFPSHSIGTIEFGPDGYLYAAGGDGASFNAVDVGQFGGSPGSPVPQNPCGDGDGEGGALRSQSVRTPATPSAPATLDGAIIRIDPDTGAAAPGNPLAGRSDAKERMVIAHGLRNPFRLAFRPGTDELWFGDVGWNDVEEIDRLTDRSTAENFGWPCYEGTGVQSGYQFQGLCQSLYSQGTGAVTAPHFEYPHSGPVVSGDGCSQGASSITGLAFYEKPGSGGYPAEYDGALFFTDYNRECIFVMTADGSGVPDPGNTALFARLDTGAVDLVPGPGGDLFWVDLFGGEIHRIRYASANQDPVAAVSASPESGPAPLSVDFSAAGSTDADGDTPLTYAWDLDGDGQFDDGSGVSASRTYTTTDPVEVSVRVTDTRGGTGTASVTVTPGSTPPQPAIATPTATQTWAVGDAVTFSGSATDAEDGTLAASQMSWRARLLTCTGDDCITRFEENFPGVASGTFVAPDWAGAGDTRIEIRLTATDVAGLSASTDVTILPRRTTVNLDTVPSGLDVVLGSETIPTPDSRSVIEGSTNTLEAPAFQVQDGRFQIFDSWSNGGAASQQFVAAPGAVDLTATYVDGGPASTTVPSPVEGGWSVNGSAAVTASEVVLTPATPGSQTGSVYWPTPVSSDSVSISADVLLAGGSGADGLCLVLADPAAGSTALGVGGGGLGFSGIDGVAGCVDTYQNFLPDYSAPWDPSDNFVGLTSGGDGDRLTWLDAVPRSESLREAPRRMTLTRSAGRVTLSLDGEVVIDEAVSLPPEVLVGFSAATGGLTDRQSISNITIDAAGGGGGPDPVPSVSVSPGVSDLGSVVVGEQSSGVVTITNTGDVPLTLSSRGGPAAPFSVGSPLTVGTTIGVGEAVTETVVFAPAAPGAPSSTITYGFAELASPSVVTVQGTATGGGGEPGSVPPPPAGGWQVNGDAALVGADLVLTTTSPGLQAGTAFWPTPVVTEGLDVTFDASISGGTGADGMSLILAAPGTAPTSVGRLGGGLGYSGIDGVAVALDTYQNFLPDYSAPADPSDNFVGIADGATEDRLAWVATETAVPSLRGTVRQVRVTVQSGRLTVLLDGAPVLDEAVTLGSTALIGFGAGTGGQVDRHAVSNVVITTDGGTTPIPSVSMTPSNIDFGSVPVGETATRAFTITNTGTVPATISSVTLPGAPFSIGSPVAAGRVLAPGESITQTVVAAPANAGAAGDLFRVGISGLGTLTTALAVTGTELGTPAVSMTPSNIDFGSVPVGGTATRVVSVTNTGTVPATISSVTLPGAPFSIESPLAGGRVLAPGETVVQTVVAAPAAVGPINDVFGLAVADLGTLTTPLTVAGVDPGGGGNVPSPVEGGWSVNGSAVVSASEVVLTPATPGSQTGSVFWPTPVSSESVTVSADVLLDGGSGADGLCLVLADPAAGSTALGVGGGGLGFSGIDGVAGCVDTFQNFLPDYSAPWDPSDNFVGLASGGVGDRLTWLGAVPQGSSLREAPRRVTLTRSAGRVTLSLDGAVVIDEAVSLPPEVLVGFSAATGGLTDRQSISAITIDT